ncbi:MAG TPA: acetyltransferase [Synergistales bacterium]|nr:acetyltransferase [Synergistales bacterium]
MFGSREVYILGGGAHGKVVASTLIAGGYKIAGVLDDNQLLLGSTVMEVPVIGPFDLLNDIEEPEAIIAIGANVVRKTIASRFPHVKWVTAIHPEAYVHDTVRIGHGTVVFAGTVIQPDVVIGDHCIINTSSSVDHDCMINNFVHIAPGCSLGSNISLEEGVFLGIGASIIPDMNIGEWSTVGAGGVVVRDVPPHSLAIGVPAKIHTDKE